MKKSCGAVSPGGALQGDAVAPDLPRSPRLPAGVCEKNTPPEKRMLGSRSFHSTKPTGG